VPKAHYASLVPEKMRESISDIILGATFGGSSDMYLCQAARWNADELAGQILSLLGGLMEEQKQEAVRKVFEEIVCPMCYRLNPQHADMDYGKGCHWCQEKEDWCGGKSEQEG